MTEGFRRGPVACSLSDKILKTATTSGPGLDVRSLKKQRQRIARAYGDGAYTDEDYQRRLDEIDAKVLSGIPVLLPSIEVAAELLDDLPGLWQEALPEERRKLLAPLVDKVYLDLKTKRISGIKPKPGFEGLLSHAVYQTSESTCALLSRDEVVSQRRLAALARPWRILKSVST